MGEHQAALLHTQAHKSIVKYLLVVAFSFQLAADISRPTDILVYACKWILCKPTLFEMYGVRNSAEKAVWSLSRLVNVIRVSSSARWQHFAPSTPPAMPMLPPGRPYTCIVETLIGSRDNYEILVQ